MGSLKIVVALAVGCFVVMFLLVGRQFSHRGASGDSAETRISGSHSLLSEDSNVPGSVVPSPGEGRSLRPQAGTPSPEFVRRREAYAKLFQQGDYAAACAIVESLLSESSEEPGLQKDFATCLFAEALKSFEKFDYESAAQLLRRSAALGNATAKQALAKVLVLKGETAEALQLLAKDFAVNPSSKTLEALVDLNLSSGSVSEAERYLGIYEKSYVEVSSLPEATQGPSASQAVSQASGQEALRAAARLFLDSRRKRLSARQKIEDQNYILSREGVQVRYPSRQAESLAERILSKAIQTVDALKVKFGATTWGSNFDIELVEDNDFSSLTGAPPWAAAVFDGTIRLPVSPEVLKSGANVTQVERNAVHETTHAFLYALCGDRIPSWLGEGLAQIQEGRSERSAAQALKNLQGSAWMALRTPEFLDRPFVQVNDSTEVRELYLRSLVLTSALERSGGSSVWRRFIMQMCTNETPLPDALEGTFGARTSSDLWNLHFPGGAGGVRPSGGG